MKQLLNRTPFSSLLLAAVFAAGISTASAWDTPIVAPAVKDGSNFSRAPFPAVRQFNDTKSQESIAAATTSHTERRREMFARQTVSTEPTLTPTGRMTYTNVTSQPVYVTPPAVKDGSNFSRAPFPAAREHNDVK
jgi:hypothetical protein